MKKIIVVAISLIAIFIINTPVFADGETPTNTITPAEGFILTPSRYSTRDLNNKSCPLNKPQYYLTKTPSSMWMLNCGNCLRNTLPALPTAISTATQTPTVTATWNYLTPTNTPTITGTPTKTVTPTIDISSGVIVTRHDNSQISLTNIGDYGLSTGKVYFNYYSGEKVITKIDGNTSGGYYVYLNISNSYYHDNWGGCTRITIKNGRNTPITLTWKDNITTGSAGFLSGTRSLSYLESVAYQAGCTGAYVSGNLTRQLEIYVPSGYTTTYQDIEIYQDSQVTNSSNKNNSVDGTVTVYLGSLEMLSATPTPTPTSLGYCAVIEEDTVDQDYFGYTGLSYGQTDCIDIGNQDVSILGIDLDIPWIAHMCATSLSLGDIYIFGMGISLAKIFSIVMIVASLGLLFWT